MDEWERWREGRKGDAAERERVRKAVRRWRDENGAYALGQAAKLDYWAWFGSAGELPELPQATGGKPVPADPRYRLEGKPTARLELLGDGVTSRLFVTIPATEAVPPGERRYIVLVSRP